MSGAWDGTRVLRCAGGPWHREEKLWRGADLEVAGHAGGRYVAWPPPDPVALVWTTPATAGGRGR